MKETWCKGVISFMEKVFSCLFGVSCAEFWNDDRLRCHEVPCHGDDDRLHGDKVPRHSHEGGHHIPWSRQLTTTRMVVVGKYCVPHVRKAGKSFWGESDVNRLRLEIFDPPEVEVFHIVVVLLFGMTKRNRNTNELPTLCFCRCRKTAKQCRGANWNELRFQGK